MESSIDRRACTHQTHDNCSGHLSRDTAVDTLVRPGRRKVALMQCRCMRLLHNVHGSRRSRPDLFQRIALCYLGQFPEARAPSPLQPRTQPLHE